MDSGGHMVTASPLFRGGEMKWQGRKAIRMENGIVEWVTLLGGGYIVVFRYLDEAILPTQNVLWEAPWPTREPDQEWTTNDTLLYGHPSEGRFLAGYSGHALCLDYFGPPSEDDVQAGLSLHGEAAITGWHAHRMEHGWTFAAALPRSGLAVTREARMNPGESVVSIHESVFNSRPLPRACDWVQHVTFGPPFLKENVSFVASSGKQSTLYVPSLLSATNSERCCESEWPYVRLGDEEIDLRAPFSAPHRELLAGVELDGNGELQFILACNMSLGLGVGYCFRTEDFPWLTVWEENCGRLSPPWNGRTQARGMEFGTNPRPSGKRPKLDTKWSSPIGCMIPAERARSARYQMFLFTFGPGTMDAPSRVALGDGEYLLFNEENEVVSRVPASDSRTFLFSGTDHPNE